MFSEHDKDFDLSKKSDKNIIFIISYFLKINLENYFSSMYISSALENFYFIFICDACYMH